MMNYEDVDGFDEEVKDLYKKHAGKDMLIEYVLVATAMNVATGSAYSIILSPTDQRPPATAGLIRMGVVASDEMLIASMEGYAEEDESDE